MKNSIKNVIYYYESAYGPSIRINSISVNWLMNFKYCILQLKEEQVNEVVIDRLENVEVVNLKSLVLTKVNKAISPKVLLLEREEQETYFWVQDNEELNTLMGLVDALILHNQPGHQYLTSEEDGIIILLSYME